MKKKCALLIIFLNINVLAADFDYCNQKYESIFNVPEKKFCNIASEFASLLKNPSSYTPGEIENIASIFCNNSTEAYFPVVNTACKDGFNETKKSITSN